MTNFVKDGTKAYVGGILTAKYFHGGIEGLLVGALLLPPSITGHKCASDYEAFVPGSAGVHKRDRVYLTSVYEAAQMFAALYPSGRGVIYEVEPIGELEHDIDCDTVGMSFAVPSARVLRCHLLSPMRRRLILKHLGVDRSLW